MQQKDVWASLLVLLVLLAGIGLLVLLMQAWSWIAGLAAVFVEGWFRAHRMPVIRPGQLFLLLSIGLALQRGLFE